MKILEAPRVRDARRNRIQVRCRNGSEAIDDQAVASCTRLDQDPGEQLVLGCLEPTRIHANGSAPSVDP
jgi:hypothetical protein